MSDKKPKLLIIDKHQFGYLTDAYKWCEWLKDDYDITFLTADVGKEKITMPGINVKYISFKMPRTMRGILFIVASLIMILLAKGIVMVEYFQGCSILKRLCPWKKMLVDVRTLSVSPDVKHRERYNSQLIKNCKYFDTITAISPGVSKRIGISGIKLLPLGSDVISTHPKDYAGNIKMLYVGTLKWRNIEITLDGLKLFVDQNPNIDIHYDIVGDGEKGQLDALKNRAKSLKISKYVTFHGFIPLTKVKQSFTAANIGMSSVPVTEYYNQQPPTKTFEYILSGLYCIATQTRANSELVSPLNGCLIPDSAEGVCNGMEQFIKSRCTLNEKTIRESLVRYKWENIVKENLAPILYKMQP